MQIGPNQQQNRLIKKLIAAVNEDDLDGVRDCLELGVDANIALGYQDYEIVYASRENDSKPQVPLLKIVVNQDQLDIAELLLQKGASLQSLGKGVLDLLFLAIQVNHADLLRRMIELGVDLEMMDLFGTTPLLRAILLDKAEMVEILIANGALVNVISRRGETYLHFAKSAYVAELLLKHGAQVNVKDDDGMTPLHLAINADVAEQLLKHKAQVDARNESGATPLHLAQNAEVAEQLIKHGAQVDAQNKLGYTPLHYAHMQRLATLLLNYDASVHIRNNNGDTPLHNARRFKSANIIEMMIARGADVNATNDNGEAPLNHRIFWSDNISLDIVQALLRNGANPHIYDEQGNYALTAYMSGDKYQPEIVVAFIEAGADIDEPLLHYAARKNDLIVMSALIQRGANPDYTDKKGRTALHYAIQAQLALYYPKENAITFLMNHGANINYKDNDGNTPLHYMFTQKNQRNRLCYSEFEIYEFISKGANIHSSNNNGMSPYMLASKELRPDMQWENRAYRSEVCTVLAKECVAMYLETQQSSHSSRYMAPFINSFMSNMTSLFASPNTTRVMRMSDFNTFYGFNSKGFEQHVYHILMKVPLTVLEACHIYGNSDSNCLSRVNLLARIVAGIEDDKPVVAAVQSAILNQCGSLVLGFHLAKSELPKDIALEISQYIPAHTSSGPTRAMFLTGFDYIQEQASKKRKPEKTTNRSKDDEFYYEAEEAIRPRKKARLH